MIQGFFYTIISLSSLKINTSKYISVQEILMVLMSIYGYSIFAVKEISNLVYNNINIFGKKALNDNIISSCHLKCSQ